MVYESWFVSLYNPVFYTVLKLFFFFQVLVVQALRPDRLQSAMSLFASKALGESNGVDS